MEAMSAERDRVGGTGGWMDQRPSTIVLCSCEDTMPLDARAVRRACDGARLLTGRQFCRGELERVRTLAAQEGPIVIGCTQEAPLFEEVAQEQGFAERMSFVNVRETAGWSNDAADAGPKMAALIAAAAVPMPEIAMVSLKSEGVVLIYGRDEQAIDAGRQLADRLDVTVLLAAPGEVVPPRVEDFPVFKGIIASAKGHLGAFELKVDDFAQPHPSSRAKLVFGPSRNGAISTCDLILDLSGGTPLFPAASLRPGYVRADPRDPAAVQKAIFTAAGLVGEFDKPRYVGFRAELCAHSRSRIVGCRRCLDVCPTGAITPAGDHVAIDTSICAGCGNCHAVCPTGAASYALPNSESLLSRLRALLSTFGEAGGRRPVLLLHDHEHGAELIDALARFGAGLPADVLPFEVNEVTQIGLETLAAAFAYGAVAVRVVQRSRPRHDPAALQQTIELADVVLEGLGFGAEACATIDADDPDQLAAELAAIRHGPGPRRPADFLPLGDKRGLTRLALAELHEVAPEPVDLLPLPSGAPFGAVRVDTEGCTLCLACVATCPTGALSDEAERPSLRFTESACVQCGLCAATCPEKVITLEPRLDFRPSAKTALLVKEEEPFCCIACGKPFGTRSTIERIVAKLENRHWMFSGENARRLEVVRMCDGCRVTRMTDEGLDPYAAPARPKPRTSDDYFRERAQSDGKPN
jgi:ferredoxin